MVKGVVMDSKVLKALVKALVGDGALAWSWKKEGQLVVILSNGEKRHFEASICQEHIKKITGIAQKNTLEDGNKTKVKKGKRHEQIG